MAVDSGFIVHNEHTYPNLLRLFAEFGVRTQDADMSMSVRCPGCGLEYAGGRGLTGLFPRPANLIRPRYLRMLGEFVTAGGFSHYLVEHFLLPVVSAVWAAPERVCRDYPARYLFAFLAHHGMLAVTGPAGSKPTWRTVTGGSRGYVERAVKHLTAVHAGTEHVVDRVVLATHADRSLALLADPTAAERTVLGAFSYSRNETRLHADTTLLPASRRAAASWNDLKTQCAHTGLAITARRRLGEHYARTLHLWRERFLAAGDQVAGLGFDDTFRRLWEFYLAYCEAGFLAGHLDVWQFGQTRP